MKWKEEREGLLARLADLEARVTALESSDEDSGVIPIPVVGDRDAEFEATWSAVMSGSNGVQVAIVNPNDPRYNGGPFVVEDNKDKIKGEGDSVVAAFAAYKTAGGRRHGDSSALDDFEYAQAEFFCGPGNIAAPTSCRHANHGYDCDFFRRGVTPAGGDKVGPFDTPGKAIEALRSELGGDL